MDKKYFKNCSDKHIILYAMYDAFTQGDDRMFMGVKAAKKYLEEEGNVGDTSLEVIKEDEKSVTFLSTDSCIKVEIKVNKENFAKSTSKELA